MWSAGQAGPSVVIVTVVVVVLVRLRAPRRSVVLKSGLDAKLRVVLERVSADDALAALHHQSSDRLTIAQGRVQGSHTHGARRAHHRRPRPPLAASPGFVRVHPRIGSLRLRCRSDRNDALHQPGRTNANAGTLRLRFLSMTCLRPLYFQDALLPVGERHTACRTVACKRHLQRGGRPYSGSKSNGHMLQ